MEEFNRTMLGRQVRFVDAKAHEEMPEYYPKVGTIGILVPTNSRDGYWGNCDFLVQWPTGSTSGCDIWVCSKSSLELVEKITDYTPEKYGIVIAIKIFDREKCWPYATLAFAFGGTVTIDWTNVKEHEKYLRGINACTLFIDERVKNKFEDYVRVGD